MAGYGWQRRLVRHLHVHQLRLPPAGQLHQEPAALPELWQRPLETLTGGDSKDDPYPDRKG